LGRIGTKSKKKASRSSCCQKNKLDLSERETVVLACKGSPPTPTEEDCGRRGIIFCRRGGGGSITGGLCHIVPLSPRKGNWRTILEVGQKKKTKEKLCGWRKVEVSRPFETLKRRNTETLRKKQHHVRGGGEKRSFSGGKANRERDLRIKKGRDTTPGFLRFSSWASPKSFRHKWVLVDRLHGMKHAGKTPREKIRDDPAVRKKNQ